MTSEEDDEENQYLMYTGLGFALSSLGSTYVVVDSMPKVASLGFFGGAILFFIAGVMEYRENENESPDNDLSE